MTGRVSQSALSKWQPKMDLFYAEPQRAYHNMFHMTLLQNQYDDFVCS